MKIFRPNNEEIVDISFNVYKISDHPKPADKKKIMIISCFSEFGCETVGVLYCVPRIIKENPGMYVIVMGWYGREYLYRHLVDEYWEIKEEFQYLRDKAFAFHHKSRNLMLVEKKVSKIGKLITPDILGRIAVGNTCCICKHFWQQTENVGFCPKCKTNKIIRSLFSDPRYWKQYCTPIPKPSLVKMAEAEKYKGMVAIFARNRTTYGRNLQPEFYVNLIKLIKSKGYEVVWMGERQSTHVCPVEGVHIPPVHDLELTFAIVSQLKFTVQFWTASTRLAALMGTPFLLFESPDQLFGTGQEGYRLSLCGIERSKIVLSHFLNVFNDNKTGLELVDECIGEIEQEQWGLKIGMVDEKKVVEKMVVNNKGRLIP